MTASRYAESEALLARARRVVPGGVYGHQSPRMVVAGAYPYFFARGEGCRVWDVDGNEFIDLMCSYGPIVLGHRHPAVEEAARRQMARRRLLQRPESALGRARRAAGGDHPVRRLGRLRQERLRRLHLVGGGGARAHRAAAGRQGGGRLPRLACLVHAGAGRRHPGGHRQRPAPSPTTTSTASRRAGRGSPRCARRDHRLARSATMPSTTRSCRSRASCRACGRCATPPASS